jgi:hypothetical protein
MRPMLARRRLLAPLALLAVSATLLFAVGCSAEEPEAPAATAPAELAFSADEEIFTPLVASVLADPLTVQATDDATHLAYELVLTNTIGQPVTLNALAVLGDGEEILRLQGDELLPWIRVMGSPEPGLVLAPGQSATVILNALVPEGQQTPRALSHIVDFSPASAMPPMITEHMQQTIATVPVSESAAMVIGSPLYGDGWLDGNGCCEASPHRSAINPVNGALYAPERFAIDFVQLDDEGRIFDGAIDDIESYAYFGAEIHAVADGPIVSMKWDLPDEKPGAHPVGLELGEYGGNHIVQDIGGGRYAFYAHLQGNNPESLEVGQQMTRGNVLGYLGNSGNTDMPHLHFHVMDSPLPLASNGLPFVFDSFTLTGTVGASDLMDCMEKSQSCNVDGARSGQLAKLMPLQRDVISVVD